MTDSPALQALFLKWQRKEKLYPSKGWHGIPPGEKESYSVTNMVMQPFGHEQMVCDKIEGSLNCSAGKII